MADHVAHAETEISASPEQVWSALTDPEAISAFMFGSAGRDRLAGREPDHLDRRVRREAVQDKGEILAGRRARAAADDPLQPDDAASDDVPESYHTLDYRLAATGAGTTLTLDQDGNDSEEQAEQFAANWQGMLDQVKKYVEEGR